ncbi:MAG: DUF2203 domain-containing protein [Phycisphaerae bacterium]|nr:DUF2203 domain-containing protein [Phycisphaerae bacterium]
MSIKQAPQTACRRDARQRLFTAEAANRTLVYLRPIVRDVVDEYRRLEGWRAERRSLMAIRPRARRVTDLRVLLERAVERLTALQQEIAAVGCELKDWERGIVDFPSLRDGCRVHLCWQLGEAEVAHWHDHATGMSGRQPLPPDFD